MERVGFLGGIPPNRTATGCSKGECVPIAWWLGTCRARETASSLNVGATTDSGTALQVIHYGGLMSSQAGLPLPEKELVGTVQLYRLYTKSALV